MSSRKPMNESNHKEATQKAKQSRGATDNSEIRSLRHRSRFFRSLTLFMSLIFASSALSAVSRSGQSRAKAESGGSEPQRYEFEKATAFDSSGKKKVQNTRQEDKYASGGATAGSTGGKYFLFEDLPESNLIHIAYASPNTSSMSAQIRYTDAEEFTELCTIEFSTSNSWFMDSSYTATSPVIYIPAGSDIRIKPAVDVNLDYLWLTNEAVSSASDIPKNAWSAAGLSGSSIEVTTDNQAPGNSCVVLTAGQSLTASFPAGGNYNVIDISYTAQSGTEAAVTVNGSRTDIALPVTPLRVYRSYGAKTADFSGGSEFTLTCTKGELRVAYVAPLYAENSEKIVVDGHLPTDGRLTVCLDGIWDVDALIYSEWAVPEKVPETLSFANSAPVPGLWSNAAYSLGNYGSASFWYSREIELAEEPAGTVLLKIGAALYGRYIYVNGALAGSYEYNYSSSLTDISGLLHKGVNTVVIMLGSWTRQNSDSSCVAHVLHDGESSEDEPGIIDSAELIFCGGTAVTAVQNAPDVDAGTVSAKITLHNYTGIDDVSDVTVRVYELGLYKNGTAVNAEKFAGEKTVSGVAVAAGGSFDLYIDDITVSDWSRDKCWTPENPYLYRLEIQTSGDTYSVRFGMRTFCFEADTGYALLNGERRFLMGTNVAIERFFDDPLRGTSPWDEEWIRKLYSEYKSINWTCFRTHLGHANSKWFDIADEMGMMIFDEYPTWGNSSKDTLKKMLPEIYTWIEDRGNHPSLIVFDAQNEATNNLNDKIIKNGREYDIQSRPWDNGWRPPEGDNDPIECHPYIIGASGISGLENMPANRPIVTTADIGWTADSYKGHPFILNEHGEYWINREGKAMSGTVGTWNAALPGVDDETRLTYYCDLMAAQIEAFRAGRAYTGLLFFCGLASSTSSAVGVTSDVLEPDISTPKSLSIHPYFKYLMENSYAPLGITLGAYKEKRTAGEKVSVPVTLINDTGKDIGDIDVTLIVKSGTAVLYADRKTLNVSAYSPEGSDGTATAIFDLKVPAYKKYCDKGSVLTLQAFYTKDGNTVFSQRKWTLTGGSLSDGKLPEYSWLDRSTLPKEYVREDYIADYGSDDSEGDDSGNGKNGGRDNNSGSSDSNQSSGNGIITAALITGGVAVAASVAAAIVLVKKKKKGN